MNDGLAHPEYPHCFRPIHIGQVRLENRIFVPAHTTNYGVNHLSSDRHLHKDLALTCLTNPRMGLEQQWPEPVDARARSSRKVLVIGGGPAGMEAA
jgi:NADPH-dependent glutamate synthase beta subunit-like oxidoreductase